MTTGTAFCCSPLLLARPEGLHVRINELKAQHAAAAKALQLQVDGLTGQLRETQATAAATVERLQQEQQTMQLAMTTVERQLAEAQERYERCRLLSALLVRARTLVLMPVAVNVLV